MLKKMCVAALVCSAMAAPVLAQKTPWSLGFSLANASVPHPFENPPQPGSSSGTIGGYGGILEKDYSTHRFTVEGSVQFAFRRAGQLRLRGGYSIRQTEFMSVYGSPERQPVNRNTTRQTARSWHFAPGYIATHPLGKFSLHAGVELPVYWLKPLESYSTWTDLMSTEADVSESLQIFPGGVSLGIGPIAGFSFQPDQWWSVGVEVRGAWMYTRIEGNYEEQSTWSGTFVTQTGTAETYRNGSLGNVQLALQLRFML